MILLNSFIQKLEGKLEIAKYPENKNATEKINNSYNMLVSIVSVKKVYRERLVSKFSNKKFANKIDTARANIFKPKRKKENISHKAPSITAHNKAFLKLLKNKIIIKITKTILILLSQEGNALINDT